jgi:uncharacterized protein (DUF1330 family)
MKTHYVIGLSMLAGVALGAAAIQAVQAQAKTLVYAVIDITAITDPEGYDAIRKVPNANMPIRAQGGHYIARTEKITALDGAAPKRFAIIAFDSQEKAQAWYNSPEQKKVNDIRMKTTKSRLFIIEGL